MTVMWSRRGVRHLIALRRKVAKDSEESAADVASRILQHIDLLQMQAGLGRLGRLPGTRELVVTGTPYIIPIGLATED